MFESALISKIGPPIDSTPYLGKRGRDCRERIGGRRNRLDPVILRPNLHPTTSNRSFWKENLVTREIRRKEKEEEFIDDLMMK